MYYAPTNGLPLLAMIYRTTYWRSFQQDVVQLIEECSGEIQAGLEWKTWRSTLRLSNHLQDAKVVNPLYTRVWCRSCLTSENSNSITSHRHTRRLKRGWQSQTLSSKVGVSWREKSLGTTKFGVLQARLSRAFNKKVCGRSFFKLGIKYS